MQDFRGHYGSSKSQFECWFNASTDGLDTIHWIQAQAWSTKAVFAHGTPSAAEAASQERGPRRERVSGNALSRGATRSPRRAHVSSQASRPMASRPTSRRLQALLSAACGPSMSSSAARRSIAPSTRAAVRGGESAVRQGLASFRSPPWRRVPHPACRPQHTATRSSTAGWPSWASRALSTILPTTRPTRPTTTMSTSMANGRA